MRTTKSFNQSINHDKYILLTHIILSSLSSDNNNSNNNTYLYTIYDIVSINHYTTIGKYYFIIIKIISLQLSPMFLIHLYTTPIYQVSSPILSIIHITTTNVYPSTVYCRMYHFFCHTLTDISPHRCILLSFYYTSRLLLRVLCCCCCLSSGSPRLIE